MNKLIAAVLAVVAGAGLAGAVSAQQEPLDMQDIKSRMQSSMQGVMQEVQQRGMEMEVTITSDVYPGMGFIANTPMDQRAFVKWNGSVPDSGATVTVVATPRQVSPEEAGQYPAPVQDLMRDQPFYLEATEVRTSASTTQGTAPSPAPSCPK